MREIRAGTFISGHSNALPLLASLFEYATSALLPTLQQREGEAVSSDGGERVGS